MKKLHFQSHDVHYPLKSTANRPATQAFSEVQQERPSEAEAKCDWNLLLSPLSEY